LPNGSLLNHPPAGCETNKNCTNLFMLFSRSIYNSSD
jgi:hypothetical protein